MDTEKKCPTCGTIKPFSEFYKNRAHPDGLTTECKPCSKKRAKEYVQKHPEKLKARREEWKKNPRYTNHTHKKCTVCKLEKSVSDFYKNKAIYDGYSTECKECSKKRTTKRQNENRTAANKYRKIWRINHPHYDWAEKSLYTHKKKGITIKISVKRLSEIATKTSNCFLCGDSLHWIYGKRGKTTPDSPSLDRLNNENYIDENNIALVHHRCNSMKRTMPIQEYLKYIKTISNRHEQDKQEQISS